MAAFGGFAVCFINLLEALGVVPGRGLALSLKVVSGLIGTFDDLDMTKLR